MHRRRRRLNLSLLRLPLLLVPLMSTAGWSVAGDEGQGSFAALSERFMTLALTCLDQEYPNKIAHVLSGDEDVAPPRELTPVFYGCYDWHSAVHGHWLLVRWLKIRPDSPLADRATNALEAHFQPDRVAAEVKYAQGEGRAAFERPYGIAWLMQLDLELRQWDDPRGRDWAAVLQPLIAIYLERVSDWLNKLAYPIRTGEHAQTAFAFALFLDWARGTGDEAFAALVQRKTLEFYGDDRACPLNYEPGGQDFLSPCLAEADLMRRVLDPEPYAAWLKAFLPDLTGESAGQWLPLARITDRRDGKLAHLDGLHLSRAWALEGMASGLPASDPRRSTLDAAARRHRQAGLAAVDGEHYAGGHWLGSFATYLVTGAGFGNGEPRP